MVLLSDYMCKDNACMTYMDEKIMYRDKSHLTTEGSVVLFTKFNLGQIIMQSAR